MKKVRMLGSKLSVETSGRSVRRRHDAGQTLLEFALMLPFLMLLGTGVAEIGRAIFYTFAVNNAATAGVEFGSQSEIQMVQTAMMQNVATQDANFGLMSAQATYGCTCDNGGGTPAESCSYPLPGTPAACNTLTCPSGQRIGCVQVTTTATFNPIFHFPGLPTSYQANGKAVMRVRQ